MFHLGDDGIVLRNGCLALRGCGGNNFFFLRRGLPPANPLHRLGGLLLQGADLLRLLLAHGAGGHAMDWAAEKEAAGGLDASAMARGREGFVGEWREWHMFVLQTGGRTRKDVVGVHVDANPA